MHRTFIHVHTVAAITCVSHNDARLPVQLRESAYIYEHKSGDVHIPRLHCWFTVLSKVVYAMA